MASQAPRMHLSAGLARLNNSCIWEDREDCFSYEGINPPICVNVSKHSSVFHTQQQYSMVTLSCLFTWHILVN